MEFYRDGIKDEEIYLFLSPNEEAHERLKVGDEVEFINAAEKPVTLVMG